MSKKIAFIATGDEITDGDIQNTTGPAMARQLAEYGFTISEHRLIPDNEGAIAQAIRDLLIHNDYLFLTGGLGPTSDDRTRFALANALDKTLVFDEASWQHLVARLQSVKLAIPENNRQQALFPTDARILPNTNGTANGCYLIHHDKHIFMLPGPPHECLPMFTQHVLPLLPLAERYKLTYLLFGTSESEIAEVLDNALASLNCRTGYRAESPYLECKVWTTNNEDLQRCDRLVEPLVRNYLVGRNTTPASAILRAQLNAYSGQLRIYDKATYGALQNALSLPHTVDHLIFETQAMNADIIIEGLEAFWQESDEPTGIVLAFPATEQRLTHPLPRRSPVQNKTYVVEWLCWQIAQWLAER